MESNQDIANKRRGRPRKVADDSPVNGEVQGLSDADVGNGKDGIAIVGTQANSNSKSKGLDIRQLNDALNKAEESLPSGVSIVRVFSASGLSEYHGNRSSAPVVYGEDAYQVNTGEIIKF